MSKPDGIPWGVTLDAIGGTKDKVRISVSNGEVLLQVRNGIGSSTVGLNKNQSGDIRHAMEEAEGKVE